MKHHRAWPVIACLCWLGCSGKVQTNASGGYSGASGSASSAGGARAVAASRGRVDLLGRTSRHYANTGWLVPG